MGHGRWTRRGRWCCLTRASSHGSTVGVKGFLCDVRHIQPGRVTRADAHERICARARGNEPRRSSRTMFPNGHGAALKRATFSLPERLALCPRQRVIPTRWPNVLGHKNRMYHPRPGPFSDPPVSVLGWRDACSRCVRTWFSVTNTCSGTCVRTQTEHMFGGVRGGVGDSTAETC